MPGPKEGAKGIVDPLKCFELFFTSDLMNEVLLRTNEYIDQAARNYKIQSTTTSQVTKEELRSLLGIFVLSGALKNNHLSSNELFDPTICGSQNLAAMSCKRFEFLVKFLHFDDRNTRDDRKKTDKFAPIRNIWELFIKQCRDLYKPGSYVTIDEQLLAFRGRCPFRMYIPNMPAKYGIKIVLVCDIRSKYMIDASPYLGKKTGITINEPLGSYYCKLLTKTIHGTNRNLTSDNWFTSIPLAEQLLKPPYNLTLIGTIRNNKQEIPAKFKHNSSRGVGTYLFGFHEKLTLVSYKPKPQKTVLLLCTMHDKPSVDPVSGKPVIIQSHNETKGAVDTFNQMCGHSSCSRKTKRWPLCMFYGMLNMALLNSYIIYVSNCEIMKTKPMTRREFLKKLSKDLCKDWCAIRLEERPRMQKRVRAAINVSIGHNTDDDTDEPGIKKGKRSRCDFCDPKLKRMSVYYCAKCKKSYCLEHRSPKCWQCDGKTR
ncbi:piggyBac transposable element-derived protein 4-like [Eurosta solidaginis]|uniref:piggyBac transposable element-derived protein 4-like n=1 Tax=Eurosta solidaginis TaxID=178769 RepID=UPI00353123EC